MLLVHGMPRIGWGLLSPSPFCLKIEVYLRMRGDAYELRPTLLANRAPRGKLPWVEQGGERIADSAAIIGWLEQRGDVLEEAVVPAEVRARAHLIRRTVEESLYFALVAERWREPAIRARYTADLLATMPRLARPVVAEIARRALEHQLWQQGYGRHDLATLRGHASDDLAAIATLLGDRPYVTGDRPRAVDASLFGLLANLWHVPVDTPLRRVLAGHPALVAFVGRMRERFAADVPASAPA